METTSTTPPVFTARQNARRPWWERIRSKLRYYINFSDTDLIELQSALGTLAFGVLAVMPWWAPAGNTFGKILTSIMPKYIYGIIMFSLGLFQFHGLMSHNIRARRVGNMSAFAVWLFLFAELLLTHTFAAEAAPFLVLAISSALVYLRSKSHYVLRA